jgi:hypothetical protein
LPGYGLIIEIYSGYSENSWETKYRRLELAHRYYRIPFLLLDVQDWEMLKNNPSQLLCWIKWRTA